MPIFEYKCEKCGKRIEALQSGRESLKTCDQVINCGEKGEIHRLISAFSFKGDSSMADKFSESLSTSGHSHSSGCGCFGTSSCTSDGVRSKYGLD